MSSHRSAALTSANLQNADLVVVMSRDQEKGLSARISPGARMVVLGDLDPLPITQRTIHDPWDGPLEAFGDSYERINRCVRELAKIVWQR
jgi:protein-tyrosine-phosphatase